MTREEATKWLETFKGRTGMAELSQEFKALEQPSVIDKVREEITAKIKEEDFARSVFRCEEKDVGKAEQCTGSIFAYNNVIKPIDKYKAESEE